MAKRRPKVGEKRSVRQPLHIDKLPEEVRKKIQELRAQGRTWSEIESESMVFVKWDALPTRVLELFPDMRIPQTNLIRWYDLRVEQVQKEVLAEAEQARVIARAFAEAGMKNADEAVVNALRDQIFTLTHNATAGNKAALIKGLGDLGFLLAEMKKNEIRERKVTVDEEALKQLTRKLDAQLKKFDEASEKAKAKLDKGKPITIDDINRIRERTFGLGPVSPSASHPA